MSMSLSLLLCNVCRLSGSLQSFMRCPALKRLVLHHNHFKGPLPPSVSALEQLELLYLHRNRLSGTLPAELCLLSVHLRMVNLSNNFIEGTLPEDIGKDGRRPSLVYRRAR